MNWLQRNANLAVIFFFMLSGCAADQIDMRSGGQKGASLNATKQVAGEDTTTGNQEETKGGDETTTDDEMSKGGEEEIIEDDMENGGDDPGQNDPAQSGKEDPIVEQEEVKPCVWFDPDNANYAAEIAGGPEGTAIPIARYLDNGRWEDNNFIFTFVTYHTKKVPGYGEQKLDEMRGWASYYTAVILDADQESCTAIASGQIADRRWMGGCFKMTTKIRMADGSDRMIALLKAGDEVLNPVTGNTQRIKRVIEGPEADKPMYEVGTLSSYAVVTEGHPFMTLAGLKVAKDLTNDDLIIGTDGLYHRVTKLVERAINPTQMVRNIELESDDHSPENHQVLADGVVSGDLYLQELMLHQ